VVLWESWNLAHDFAPGSFGLRLLTSCSSTAHGAITRVVAVASDISHARIVQALILKLPSVHVLHAPETACSYGGGLRARRDRHGCGGVVGHCAEGTEEFGQKGHGEVGEER
jgi:hypothetical protein